MIEADRMLRLAREYFNHIVEADNLSFAKYMAAIGSSEIGDWIRENDKTNSESTHETKTTPST